MKERIIDTINRKKEICKMDAKNVAGKGTLACIFGAKFKEVIIFPNFSLKLL